MTSKHRALEAGKTSNLKRGLTALLTTSNCIRCLAAALSIQQEMTGVPQPGFSGLQDPIPLALRKSIAVYEAGKALIAYITPDYDEIARVSICPYNMVTGVCYDWC